MPAFFQLGDYGTLQIYNNLEFAACWKKRDLTGKKQVGIMFYQKHKMIPQSIATFLKGCFPEFNQEKARQAESAE